MPLPKPSVVVAIENDVFRRLDAAKPDRPLDDDRRLVIEWMRHGRRRVNPLQTVTRQRQRSKKGRCSRERVNCGTDVVYETGQRQLRRP